MPADDRTELHTPAEVAEEFLPLFGSGRQGRPSGEPPTDERAEGLSVAWSRRDDVTVHATQPERDRHYRSLFAPDPEDWAHLTWRASTGRGQLPYTL